MLSKLIYVENKSRGLSGKAWIGRGFFTRSRQTVYFNGKVFQRTQGYKYNHFDVETGEEYWISGVKKDGTDRLYNERVPITMDESVVSEYLDFTGLSELPKNKFVLKKLNNVPAKSIAEEAFNSTYEPSAEELAHTPLYKLSEGELRKLALHYEQVIAEVHKKARKNYIRYYNEIKQELEKRGKEIFT
ncbi:MAG: hypothetical protein IM638_06390 [Bacteroidetes bacterium]|nr:hypothetical protein [Bacteroidota bacterium]